MRPNEGMRTPFLQAKYWRQSRSSEEIAAKIADLTASGAPFLAHCIDSVGPQHGDPVTNAIPGLSWHQWGEALDWVWPHVQLKTAASPLTTFTLQEIDAAMQKAFG